WGRTLTIARRDTDNGVSTKPASKPIVPPSPSPPSRPRRIQRGPLRRQPAQVDPSVVLVDRGEAVLGRGGVFGLTAVGPDPALAAGTHPPPVAGALPTRVPQFRHPGITRTGSMPVRSKGAISEPVVGSPPQLVTVSGRARMESRICRNTRPIRSGSSAVAFTHA